MAGNRDVSASRRRRRGLGLRLAGEDARRSLDGAEPKLLQALGPPARSRRKAHLNHKNYDMEMIDHDNQLPKKKVTPYEPIWIHTENESQPVQIVVMRIEKNLIHGYVSAPKYRPSELATSGTASSLTPVSAHVPANGNDGQTQPSTNPPPQ